MTVLEGQDAIDVWQLGRDAWNAWVEENPEASVSFAGADFSNFGEVDFSSFRFPNGSVIFDDARFGDGNVFFNNVEFCDGEVSFRSARFGDAYVSFSEAIFGKGDVSFAEAQFGDGERSFYRVKFGDGDVSFDNAQFGKGKVLFFEAQFGKGDITFVGTQFGVGVLSFVGTQFVGGKLVFVGAQFGDGDILFVQADFGGAIVIVDEVQFSSCAVSFAAARFEGPVIFQTGKKSKGLKSLRFQGSVFDGPAHISGSFTCVPDLRGSSLAAHIDLDGLVIEPLSGGPDKEDAAKYRRLRELAENNRHHEASLRFFAQERRALRDSGQISPVARTLDWLYDMLSNYGQSIRRPAVALVGLTVLSTLLLCLGSEASFRTAGFTALADSVPFLPTSRAINIDQETQAIDGDWPRLWRLFHQFAAFVLLFLIGVGLRNRFRL